MAALFEFSQWAVVGAMDFDADIVALNQANRCPFLNPIMATDVSVRVVGLWHQAGRHTL
jgi:hypothetical protein